MSMDSKGGAKNLGEQDAPSIEPEATERELARAREAYVRRLARFGLLQPPLSPLVKPEPDAAGGPR